MPNLLSDDEIETALAALPGWRRDGDTLRRETEAPDFLSAIGVVDEVARVAEGMDHHPDIDIRWRTLRWALSTHSEGGITGADVVLAGHISAIADRVGDG